MQPFKRESGDSPSLSAKQAFIGRPTKACFDSLLAHHFRENREDHFSQ
jgi:hypothetical protein